MIFWISLIVIFLISVLLSVRSLMHEISKPKELHKIKKSLAKEKILFKKN